VYVLRQASLMSAVTAGEDESVSERWNWIERAKRNSTTGFRFMCENKYCLSKWVLYIVPLEAD
jgi:hypothetical protein